MNNRRIIINGIYTILISAVLLILLNESYEIGKASVTGTIDIVSIYLTSILSIAFVFSIILNLNKIPIEHFIKKKS